MRFSIIVPIYNTELYLIECVESVLAQTFCDWELILVDDGSLDQSGILADHFEHVDRRIKVIHKKNEGQLWARRDGMYIAKGEYILFLDSDDYWHRDCLDILAKKIDNMNPDILVFPARKVNDSGCKGKLVGEVSKEEHWMRKEHIYWTLISGVDYNSMCLKAWKRELFEGDPTDYRGFTGTCWGEDKAQLLYPVTKANSILYIPEELYYYRCNPTSVIQNTGLQNVSGMISNQVFALVYSYMHQWDMVNVQTREAIAVCYLRNFLSVYYRLRKLCRNSASRRQFRMFKWNQVVCSAAFRYAYSSRLTPKEKLKLFIARYIRFI